MINFGRRVTMVLRHLLPQGSVARNVLSNWLVLVAGIAYTFFITPVVIRALGQELYGVWSFLNGLLAYSDLLYLGLGSALIKYVAQARARGEFTSINRLVSVVFTIYTGLGVLCCLVLLLLSRHVDSLFAEPLTPEMASAATFACGLLGVKMLFVFWTSAFVGFLYSHERFDLVNAVALVTSPVLATATLLLVRPNHEPLMWLAVVTVVTAIGQLMAYVFLAFRIHRGLSLRFVRPTRSELGLLYGFGLTAFAMVLSFKLINYADTTVIGIMVGAGSVALYTLPLQLMDYARIAIGGFSSVFLPRLSVMFDRGDMAALRSTYVSSARIGLYMGGWLSALLLTLGPSFLARWVGPTYGDVRFVTACLAGAMLCHVLAEQVSGPFYQAMHEMRWPATFFAVEGICNLAVSVFLAPRMGLNGVALGTLLPALVVSSIVLPVYLARRLALPIRELLLGSALPGLVLAVVVVVMQWPLAILWPEPAYLTLAIRALATIPAAIAVAAWMFPREDRDRVLGVIRPLLIWRQPGVSAAT